MSLHGIRRELSRLLVGRGRADLAVDALDRVVFTDDGATIYVHILPKSTWRRRRPGQAYVLAHAEKNELRSLAEWREMLWEARLLLHDDADDIVRWFDGA